MKGLVRLMREHSVGAASGTGDRIPLEAYLALSVIRITSLGGNENNDTGITLGGALDPENTGFIAVENFTSLVEHHELQLDPSKLDMLLALVQSNEEGQMSSKRSSSFRRAIANGRRTLQREILLDETGLGLYKRFVRYVAYEILPCETDRRWYFHQNRLCPPPVFIAIVTIVQIIVFMCYGIMLNKWVLQTYQPDFMKSPLVYHPGHRAQVWRFFSYMFMHVGLEQLGFNALLQLMIGVPLEMVHGILRISLLYMAGVLAGLLVECVAVNVQDCPYTSQLFLGDTELTSFTTAPCSLADNDTKDDEYFFCNAA
ncbi:Rhomboid-related protein 1 [Nibea albiflora]|uniref:Rhomboid-related protein 1 n=1 Tax=Nibea albiflora TaxID=240163 RepID=A0ACB7F456_NIBAL|nr:Rhomboid-related protein 1 [Nibea albiflora]